MDRTGIVGNLKSVSWHDFFSVRSLGYALVRAWGFLNVFGVFSDLVNVRPAGPLPGVLSMLASAVALASAGVFPSRAHLLLDSVAGRIVAACLCPLGTIVMIAASTDGGGQVACAAGMAITGAGASLTMLFYGRIYGKRTTLQNAVEVPFSLLIAAVVFAVIASLPAEHAILVGTFLPTVSSAIAYTLCPRKRNVASIPENPINVARFARKLGIAVVLAGFADGIVRAAFFHAEQAGTTHWFLNPCIWSCLLSVCVICPCVLFARRMDLRAAYRSVMFLMAAFFMLLPTLTYATFARDVIALSGFEVFTAFIWIYLARIAKEWNYSSMMVFGIGWGLVYLGNLLGIVGSEIVHFLSPLSPEVRSLVAFVAAASVLLSYFFVFDESDMAALSQRPKEKKTDRMPFKEACESIAKRSGLSPRETEVLMLAAKGRTLPKIQEELYISQGTAATHMRHVYKKLGVHSRQELLELVDGQVRNENHASEDHADRQK